MKIEQLPQITVIIGKDGHIFSLNNRRLYVFRKLEAEGLCNFIECQVTTKSMKSRKLSTKNGGVSVSMHPARGSVERCIPLICKNCPRAAMCARGFCNACCPAYSVKYCATHFNHDTAEYMTFLSGSMRTQIESLALAAAGCASPHAS